MDTILNILKKKKNKQASKIWRSKQDYIPGTVMIRIKNNTALLKHIKRILGIDKDEDWD